MKSLIIPTSTKQKVHSVTLMLIRVQRSRRLFALYAHFFFLPSLQRRSSPLC